MDLYIGNATRQIYDFTYRVPEQNSIRSQKIQPGTQVRVTGNLTTQEIDAIVGQHEIYGIVQESNIDRSRGFIGICYSVGKPITAARLAYLLDHNLDALIIQGKEIRQANAIAQNGNLQSALVESGRPERMNVLDMTIQQENFDPKNDVAQFSAGVLVTAAEQPRGPRQTRAQRRKAA